MKENKINPFCFIHIEKAAGTTLHHWLGNNFRGYYTLKPGRYRDCTKAYFTDSEFRIWKMLCPFFIGFGGHSTRHFAEYDKSLTYITFLRDPVSRYLSHFAYQRDAMGINWTIEGFMQEEKFNDFMTKRISPSGCADMAIEELKNKYSFVGLTEYFNESLLMLTKLIFQKQTVPLYERRNEARQKTIVKFEELPENIKHKIFENNKNDIIVYNYVKNNIFELQKSLYGKQLDKDLVDMEESLKEYKYSFLKQLFFILRNKYSNIVVEPIAKKAH